VTAAAPCAEVRITGQVTHAAEVRCTAGHESRTLLMLEVTCGKGLPCLVQQDYGTDRTGYAAASAKAQALSRGAYVTAIGHGLWPRTDHDRAVLRLIDCTDVIPVSIPQPATTAAQEE
jgi:hypothetical protein